MLIRVVVLLLTFDSNIPPDYVHYRHDEHILDGCCGIICKLYYVSGSYSLLSV